MGVHDLKPQSRNGRQAVTGRLRLLRLVTCFLLLQCVAWASLDPGKAITQYTRQFWQTDAGLPQQSVTALAQTPDGFLWLGTEEGLVRFDGAQFTTLDKTNTPGLRSSIINALRVDNRGVLWIATRGGGLATYQDGKLTPFGPARELANSSVSALTEDGSGALWIGTDDAGLYKYVNGTLHRFGKEEGLTTTTIFSLAADSQGLWIGTDSGLYHWAKGSMSRLSNEDGLPGDQIHVIRTDGNSLWIGTDRGLVQLANGRLSNRTSPSFTLPTASITALYRDRAGSLWIGTLDAGLFRVANGKIESLSNREGLTGTGIWSLLEDREGNLWLGGVDGGLGCLRNGIFTPFGKTEGLSSETITAMYESHDHTLWLGSDSGLTAIKDGRILHYDVQNGLPAKLVLSLTEDGNGDLWVGTRTGLARFHNNVFQTVGRTQGFAGTGSVLSLFRDQLGRVWVGTRGMLSRFDGQRFTTFDSRNGLPPSLMIAINQAADGTLWIGTDGGGLVSFANERFHRLTTLQGLSSNAIWAIQPDTDGSLWLGTNGGGLVHYQNNRFTPFQKSAGLSDDVVFQVLDDQRGRLWMSSNKGVFSVEKSNLIAFAAHHAEAIQSTLYGPGDGLRGRECNGGFQPAGVRASDGRLWFPTMRGAVAVNPAGLETRPQPPAPILETLSAGKYHSRLSEAVQLPPNRKQWELKFTVPYFTAPDRLQFRYQLENFDKEWVTADSRRTAYYTNVPPGNYLFRVQACLGDRCFSSKPSGLIRLEPAFYETRLFMFLVLATAGLLFFGLHRVRVRSLRAQEQRLRALVEERTSELRDSRDQLRKSHEQLEIRVTERTRDLSVANSQLESEISVRRKAELEAQAANKAKSEFLTNMSHELRTPINGIMGMTDIMLCTVEDPEQIECLGMVKTSADALLHIVNDILDFSNIESRKLRIERMRFSLGHCIQNLQSVLLFRAREKGLQFTMPSVAGEIDQLIGDPDRLQQVLLNLLDNAFKFTSKGSVALSLAVPERTGRTIVLRFEVKDTGIGIPAEKLNVIFQAFSQADYSSTRKYGGTGLGLTIASELAQLMGGQLSVESTVGCGTTVTFTVSFETANYPAEALPASAEGELTRV